MADPFSVTGTAVGITSLGIQVCQGLVQYYSQARSYHDDIDAAIQQVEGLEGILKGLSRVGLETSRDGDSSEASEKLETAMRACQSCLRSLEEQLKKCRATKEPERLQDHVKLIRKRLLWPFKKDTIASLQVTLDRMQANVELALHILGVDINNRQFMKVMSSNQAIIERHDILDVKQEHQIATLQRVEDGIEQQTSTMNAHMAYNAMQLSGVLTQLHLLVDRSGRSQNPNQMPPSLLEDTITTFEETQTSYKRDLRKYKKSVKRVQKSSHAQLQACQCRYPAKQSTYWRSWARVLIRSKWQSDHLPDCPHFEHGDFELAVEVDFRNFAHLLHRRISLGIGYSRCRGEFAIFPKIRYKAVVPPDSPGFKPLYDAIEWIRSIKKDGHGEVQGTKQEAERLCEEIQATIMTSFHERTASPVDTLANGETILHLVCHLLHNLIRWGLVDTTTACTFMDSFIAAGVPLNEKSDYEHILFLRTPLDKLLRPTSNFWRAETEGDTSAMFTTCSFLVQRVAEETWSIDTVVCSRRYMQWLSHCLSQDDSYITHENPVSHIFPSRAPGYYYETSTAKEDIDFMRRSLPALQKVLTSGQWDVRKPPPIELVYWPEGLHSYPLQHVDWSLDERAGNKHISCAIELNDVASVSFLIEGGALVSDGAFDMAAREAHRFNRNDQERLFSMLTENMKHQATIDNNQVPNNLYHFVGLNSVAVEYLWEAGFNAVNSIAQIFHSHHTGTPAWVQALNFGGSSQEVSDVLEWLESKGAPMDWIHPTFGTTPLHVFVRRLADIILRPRISDEMDSGYRSSFSLKAMLSDYRDSCVCPCSDGGCAPITCAIQETIDSTSVSLWVLFDFGLNVWYSGLPRIDLNSEGLGNRAAGLVSHLFSQVDACENNLPWLGGTILRVMTFERLHLTHTCCRFIGKELGSWPDYLPSHTRPCREEAEEIHESEGKYIDVLENLLPQFEQQWKQYHGKFADFIKNVWEVRMGEEDTNLTGDPREERAKIRELGVVLDPYESEDSDGESVYEDAVAIPFGPERPPEMQ